MIHYTDLFIDFDDTLLFNRWGVDTDECPQPPTFTVNHLKEIMKVL